ncbi:MAG: hypothetical protein ACW99F_04685 [Candidatus Hodarchaeales archaeon]
MVDIITSLLNVLLDIFVKRATGSSGQRLWPDVRRFPVKHTFLYNFSYNAGLVYAGSIYDVASIKVYCRLYHVSIQDHTCMVTCPRGTQNY